MILESNKRKFAVGLEWSIPASPKAAKAEAAKNRKAWAVVVPGMGAVHLGLYNDPATKGVVYSGALLVGMVAKDAIVCQSMDETHAWVCTISDGLPVAGRDRVVPVDQASALASEDSTLFPQSPFIGDLTGAHQSLEQVLDELDDLVQRKEITRKQLDVAKLQRQGISPSVVVVPILLMGLAAGGWYGWQTYQRLQKSNALKNLKLKDIQRQAFDAEKVEQERQAAIAAFKQKVEAKRAELVESIGLVTPLWVEWESVRQALPMTQNGYVPTTMECDSTSCKLAWQGAGKFTVPADKLSLPGVQQDREMTLTASSVFQVGAARSQPPVFPALEGQELQYAMMHSLMVTFPGFQMDPIQPVVVQPPADKGLKPVTVGAEGVWRITIAGPGSLIQANDFVQRMARWPVSITTARYSNLTRDVSIDLTGRYGGAAEAPAERR